MNPADIPENDGIPGEIFSAQVTDNFVRFETVQTAMDLTIDVAYRGPVTRGAPFACHLQSTVAYGDGRDRAASDASADTDTPRPAGPLFVGCWGRLPPPQDCSAAMPSPMSDLNMFLSMLNRAGILHEVGSTAGIGRATTRVGIVEQGRPWSLAAVFDAEGSFVSIGTWIPPGKEWLLTAEKV